MTGRPVEWTDEQVAAVKDMWGRGLSAGQIAAQMPSFTRNAIIGKIDRLGLTRNPGERQPRPSRAKPETVRRVAQPKPIPAWIDHAAEAINNRPFGPGKAIDFETPSDGKGIQLVELTNVTCRWPKGLVGADDFCFCGEPTADLAAGKPYCPYHTRLARRA